MNVSAVVVAFNPNEQQLNTLVKSLSPQVKNVIVANNSSYDLSFNLDNCTVLNFGENLGIAEAQNRGVQELLNRNADYIALFDQDSVVSSTMIGELANLLETHKSTYNLACIGPRIVDSFSGDQVSALLSRESNTDVGVTTCKQIIASGQLISREALLDVGLMESQLFIDSVDFEWCWRARSKGYTIAIAENVLMTHSVGDARRKFLGITYIISSPIRKYYQFRNILNVSRRSYPPLYWKVRSLLSIPIQYFLMGFGGKDSKVYRKYMIDGIKDGLLSRYGSYDECRKK